MSRPYTPGPETLCFKIREAKHRLELSIESDTKALKADLAILYAQRNDLVIKNSALVGMVVSRLPHFIVRMAGGYDEATGIGELALIYAVEQFDPTKGFQLSTYATTSIWRRIYRTRFSGALIHWPSNALAECKESGDYSSLPNTIQWPCRKDSRSKKLLNFVDESVSVSDSFERSEFLTNAIRQLPKKLRQIIQLRYFKGLTLKKIGSGLGFSHQYARQLQAQAIRELRRLMGVKHESL